MLPLWHQEHLAMASSAPRVVTSNGLLRALARGLFVYHQWKPVIVMWQQYFKIAPQQRTTSILSCGCPQGSACDWDLTAQLLSHFPTQVSVSSETTEKKKRVLIPPFHQKNACLWRSRTRLNRALSTPAPWKTGKVLICYRRHFAFPGDVGVRLILLFSIDSPTLKLLPVCGWTSASQWLCTMALLQNIATTRWPHSQTTKTISQSCVAVHIRYSTWQ